MFCPNCGNRLSNNCNICPNCGNHLSFNPETNFRANKKKLVLGLTFCFVLIALIIFIFIPKDKKENNNQDKILDNKGEITEEITNKEPFVLLNEYGTPKFIDGSYSSKKINNSIDALDSLNDIKDLLKIQDINKELVLQSEVKSEDITYYKFKQVYNDLEVLGQSLIISTDKEGNILSLSGEYIPSISLNVDADIKDDEVEKIIKEKLGDKALIEEKKLGIMATKENSYLIVDVIAYNDEVIKEYYIDVINKNIIRESFIIDEAAYQYTGEDLNGQKQTITIDTVKGGSLAPNLTYYRFVDEARNIYIVDGRDLGADALGILLSNITKIYPITGILDIDGQFIYGNNTVENQNIVKNAISTMKIYEDIYDYYKNILNRDSYDNKGGKIVVNLGVQNKTFTKNNSYQNASWLSPFN